MKLSERLGLVPLKTALQTDDMDDALRNSLWNLLDMHIWNRSYFLYSPYGSDIGEIDDFSRDLWFHFFKKPMDTRSSYAHEILEAIRKWFFEASWYEVYEFMEYVLPRAKSPRLADDINIILERELAGFRLVEEVFIPVTDKEEVESLQEALKKTKFGGVKAHLRQAMEHLSNQDKPDYRNSIKESISAVESMAQELTYNPKATLGEALTVLEKSGKLHTALKKGFSAIYGYTSDEGGIRHAMLEEPNVTASDAKFFLISCATFINYLSSKID